VYQEGSAPGRIISTIEYEAPPDGGHVVLDATSFYALPGGRPRVIVRSAFLSMEDRDAMLHSGMDEGLGEIVGQLDERLLELS
jgi:hypothetical protein